MDPLSHPVGELVARRPLAATVLRKHGIDFCCGGQATLEAACAAKGVDAGALLDEIDKVDPAHAPGASWLDRPQVDLVDHLLARYHRPLDTLLPELRAMARRVATVHGHRDDVDVERIAEIFEALHDDLVSHMEKEEQILFPWIRSGKRNIPEGPFEVMEAEHDAVGALLDELRELTNDYTLPPGACATWTALWRGGAILDVDLRDHIHLENNVLFPRARG
jgi:regulator of cell morphogenesis and NO signaling